MPFDMQRKISYFNHMMMIQNVDLSKLETVTEQDYLPGMKKSGYDRFCSNLMLLDQYNKQCKGEQADAVSDAAAQKAWNDLSKQLSSFQFSDIQKRVGPLARITAELKKNFALAQAHEKEADKLKTAELLTVADQNDFDAEDAKPFLESFNKVTTEDRLFNAFDAPVAQGNDRIRAYGKAMQTMQAYARSQNDPNAQSVSMEDVKQAWSVMKQQSPALLQDIQRDLKKVSPLDPHYDELMRLHAAVGVGEQLIAGTEARGKVRAFRRTYGNMDAAIEAVNREIAEDAAASAEIDEDAEGYERDVTDEKLSEVRNELSNYRMSNNGLYETEMAKLNSELNALHEKLPAAFRGRLHGAASLSDVAEMDRDSRSAYDRATGEHGFVFRNLENDLKKAIPLKGTMKSAERNKLVSDLVNVMQSNLTGKSSDGKTVESALERALGGNSPALKENKEAIRNAFRENLMPCSHAVTGVNQAAEYMKAVDTMWQIKTLEGKRALLVQQNRYVHDRTAEQTMEKLSDSREAGLHRNLHALEEMLNSAHKFGMDSKEYKNFRDSLHRAAQGGDAGELLENAKKYMGRKDLNPKTEVGKIRLSVAQQAAELARAAVMYAEHPVVPVNEQNAPKAEAPAPQAQTAQKELTAGDVPDDLKSAAQWAAEPWEKRKQMEIKKWGLIPDDPQNPPVYMPLKASGYTDYKSESPDGRIDQDHEFLRTMLEVTLGGAYGFGVEDSKRSAEKMMDILNKNLTGNKEADLDRFYHEFRMTFVEPGDPSFPKLPNIPRGKVGILTDMEKFVSQYDDYAAALDSGNYEPNMGEGERANTIYDSNLVSDPMNRIRVKQVYQIRQNMEAMEIPEDSAFAKDILKIVQDKGTPDKVRTLIEKMSGQQMGTLQDAYKNHQPLSTYLQQAMKEAGDLNVGDKYKQALEDHRKVLAQRIAAKDAQKQPAQQDPVKEAPVKAPVAPAVPGMK